MKVYIERNNEEVELIRYRKHVDFVHVYFCEATDSMQYRPRNLNHVFSNTNHCGSIFDSLSRLSARVNARRVLKSLTIMYLNLISTALAENTLTTMDLANRAVIRPHLAPGRLIHFSADNSDINDGTLDGKHTLHATL